MLPAASWVGSTQVEIVPNSLALLWVRVRGVATESTEDTEKWKQGILCAQLVFEFQDFAVLLLDAFNTLLFAKLFEECPDFQPTNRIRPNDPVHPVLSCQNKPALRQLFDKATWICETLVPFLTITPAVTDGPSICSTSTTLSGEQMKTEVHGNRTHLRNGLRSAQRF